MKRIALGTAVMLAASGLLAIPAVSAVMPTGDVAYGQQYVDELFVSNGLEQQGIVYLGRKVAIDNASCIGLRRYGVKTSSDGFTDTFWRFRCNADGANGHIYDVQLSTTSGPKATYIYWHFLSVKKML